MYLKDEPNSGIGFRIKLYLPRWMMDETTFKMVTGAGGSLETSIARQPQSIPFLLLDVCLLINIG